MRRGLLAVGDPKRDNRQEVSTKSGEICGSLAGTDPHCSTWILGVTNFFHWMPGVGSLGGWFMQKRAQLLPPVSCLDMRNRDSHDLEDWPWPEGQGGGLEPQHSLCQLPSCGRILLPRIQRDHTIDCNNVFGVVRCEMVWGETPCTDCLSPLGSSCRQECHTACPDHGEILQTHKLNLSQ